MTAGTALAGEQKKSFAGLSITFFHIIIITFMLKKTISGSILFKITLPAQNFKSADGKVELFSGSAQLNCQHAARNALPERKLK